MNFKLLFILIFVAACGVKGDPVAPTSERVPSLMENYPDITTKEPLNDTSPAGKSRKR